MVKRGYWVVIAIVMVVGCKKKGDDPIAQFRTGGSAAATGSATAAGSSTTTPTGSAATAATPAAGSAAAGSATAAAGSAATGSAAGSAAVAEGFKVGDPVLGQWTDGDWYPGKIGKINDDGTYRVNYTDGDVSPSLSAKKVRPRKASASSGKSSSASASKGGAEPCPASHWTRCPDNNCHPLMDDRWNCGACGHSCPSNMSICRNGTCDCTGIEKDSNGGACPPP